ncbi:MAG: MFS transporter [Lachnospiraceae bacterium]|nr:MFS transporter [Lachnospiraceae bacterium]
MSEKISVNWTVRYTLLNVAYFAAFCTVHAYAAVFLYANGFNNTEVGVLLALANIVSAILQPVIAGVIDKGGFLTNRRFIILSVMVIFGGSLILMFVPGKKAVIFLVYALIYMIQFAYQPVMTALCFEYRKAGCNIFYGLARGLGSASFAVTSMFIGGIVERNGISILLWTNIATMVISALIAFTFIKPARCGMADPEVTGVDLAKLAEEKPKAHNLAGFVRTYPAFVLFLVGVVCFFFAHNMINDFMIQIIRNLGGGETELGYANFLQAILELPVMALIAIVLKKISSSKLLLISGVAFLVKILILIFAKSRPVMYLSQSFQLFAYAVFIPAGAYYVSTTMDEYDQVKGQAFITSAITIGGVFSNLISGVILDHSNITTMLITGSAVCAAGVIIAFYAMLKLPHRRA